MVGTEYINGLYDFRDILLIGLGDDIILDAALQSRIRRVFMLPLFIFTLCQNQCIG